ncbi:hypothetical protein [Methylocapsa acidiphila]|uniref:hypothetical protein n=1 Tax=Methylocapsa acidiphila TaxID=133552 RepID=UPI000563D3C0|nr:hypothetical protein [Methylocapsa acidiphila]
MSKRISALLVGLSLFAGAPVHAGESETLAAAQDFIASLTSLDAALLRLHELMTTAKISSLDLGPICAALDPDPKETPDTPEVLSDLLQRSNIERSQARSLCDAQKEVRTIGEHAKTANLLAATECKKVRVPACDAANEAVAAARETRARMEAQQLRRP